MKFQAHIVFEFKADSVAEAGQRLDQLLKHAEDHYDLAADAVELRSPPSDTGAAPSVVLPSLPTPARAPGPQAASVFAGDRLSTKPNAHA
jgi:hypothetical protein